MLAIIDALDITAESRMLSDAEVDAKSRANKRLASLLCKEELKWYQRAKVKHLMEGDDNTSYFYLIANGKHRKQRIYKLDQDEGLITDEVQLRDYVTRYYKKLFGPSDDSFAMLADERRDDIAQVSDEENSLLTATFSEEEVRRAVFQIEHNKAPGPDGFPAEFFPVFFM